MALTAELKTGFILGLGVALAFLVLGVLQGLTLRAVRRNG